MTAPEADTAERLLIEAAQKNPARFAEIYENNFDRVYGYIARRVGSRDIAEDLTSDVFHKALAGLPRFEWRGVPFGAWLIRIASNAIIDRAKRAAKESDVSSVDEPTSVSPREIEEIEQRARLFKLVDQLPPNQRRVIALRFAEEKSVREVALEMARTEGAVKQLQFRALQNLRAQLSEESGDTNG
ncbi:MAG TPA: sigma-70 family RNA polymerase sigma factor [Blastocatellia bacterium]|nr:sigma-70 family RNA polymerase sigma factor [Blastocatellia bacterium]